MKQRKPVVDEQSKTKNINKVYLKAKTDDGVVGICSFFKTYFLRSYSKNKKSKTVAWETGGIRGEKKSYFPFECLTITFLDLVQIGERRIKMQTKR